MNYNIYHIKDSKVPIIDRLENTARRIIHRNAYKHINLLFNEFYQYSYSLHEARNYLLKNILLHALENSIYYKEIVGTIEISEDNLYNVLKEFPILTKQVIRTNYHKIKSNSNIPHKLFNTGGSTGEPFEFPLSKTSGIIDYRHQKEYYLQNNYVAGKIIAAFDGTAIPFNKRRNNKYWLRKKIGHLPYGSYRFSSHYFNDETCLHYIRKFLEIKPTFIRGYPSFIYDFVQKLIENNIRVDFVKNVQLTAETIYNYQIDYIKDYFNCDVYGQYGNSEATIYALTDKNNLEYYCSPLYSFVEILSDDNKHVSIGKEGEIVTTGFYNYIMPFIRYKTGDRAVYGGEDDGIVKLIRITGRTQEFIYDNKFNKINITGIVFGQHFKAFSNIKKWQIIQNEVGKIIIKIIPTEEYTKDDEEEIISNISNQASIEVKIKICNYVELSNRGKMLLVKNNIR